MNDENRMTNDELNPNDETRKRVGDCITLSLSFWLRHSTFELRHSSHS